jgi:hypothetical protein
MGAAAQNIWGKDDQVKLVVHFGARGACHLAYVVATPAGLTPCRRIVGDERAEVDADDFPEAVRLMERLLHEQTIEALNARWRERGREPVEPARRPRPGVGT